MSLRVGRDETVALTGPSGGRQDHAPAAVIAGLETSYVGTRQVPDGLAMVFQEPVLMPWRRVEANLTIPCRIDAAEAGEWLERVGLAGLGARWPAQLSLGQQRRLSLARAFASAPDLLLLDEPFVSLDPKTADEMMSLFERLKTLRPVATILVSHVEAEATRLAHRVLRLGGIAGPPAGLTSHHATR